MRYAFIQLSPVIVLELFKNGFKIDILNNPIPSDAKFIRMYTDDGWNTIKMVIESTKFIELKEGDLIPELVIQLYKK